MTWTWLVTVASLIGVIANIHELRWCFAVWFCTNITWMVVDWRKGLYAQSALFAVYTGLAVWGWFAWA